MCVLVSFVLFDKTPEVSNLKGERYIWLIILKGSIKELKKNYNSISNKDIKTIINLLLCIQYIDN